MQITARTRRAGWVSMTVLATLTALASARYFSLNPATFIPGQAAVYLAHLGPLLLHVGGGIVALAIGPWQLWIGTAVLRKGVRPRIRTVHRLLGRTYLIAVLAAGLGGLLLAPLSQGGPLAHLGFGALAVALLLTSTMGLISIRQRHLAAHRAWMTRSYALIFTAVTFRVWLGVLVASGLPFDQVYAVGAWTSWLINLVGVEVLISRTIVSRGRSAAHPAGHIRPREGLGSSS
jgi:uncharacterized membrane protein